MIHPLQLASAMLVLIFATALFASTQFFIQQQLVFSQQQLGKHRVRPVIQVATLPM